MVERHSRDLAAQALMDFMLGLISNREYERRFPRSEHDAALWSIYSQVWFYYSDTLEHTLAGKHALTDEGRAFIERCLLFLKSDLEFKWPPSKLHIWYPFFRLIGLARIVNRKIEKEMTAGDTRVWPFLNRTEYEQSLGKTGRWVASPRPLGPPGPGTG